MPYWSGMYLGLRLKICSLIYLVNIDKKEGANSHTEEKNQSRTRFMTSLVQLEWVQNPIHVHYDVLFSEMLILFVLQTDDYYVVTIEV